LVGIEDLKERFGSHFADAGAVQLPAREDALEIALAAGARDDEHSLL
jgi:hypothetical protein